MTAARPTVWRAFCQEWEWEGVRHSTALTAVHLVLQRVNPKITHYSVGSRSRTMYCTDSGVQVLYSYGETGWKLFPDGIYKFKMLDSPNEDRHLLILLKLDLLWFSFVSVRYTLLQWWMFM